MVDAFSSLVTPDKALLELSETTTVMMSPIADSLVAMHAVVALFFLGLVWASVALFRECGIEKYWDDRRSYPNVARGWIVLAGGLVAFNPHLLSGSREVTEEINRALCRAVNGCEDCRKIL